MGMAVPGPCPSAPLQIFPPPALMSHPSRLLLPAAAAGLLLIALHAPSAQAAQETSPCTKGLQAKGYTVRDVDNHGWYDEIDVTDSKGKRLELDVRRSDCVIIHQNAD